MSVPEGSWVLESAGRKATKGTDQKHDFGPKPLPCERLRLSGASRCCKQTAKETNIAAEAVALGEQLAVASASSNSSGQPHGRERVARFNGGAMGWLCLLCDQMYRARYDDIMLRQLALRGRQLGVTNWSRTVSAITQTSRLQTKISWTWYHTHSTLSDQCNLPLQAPTVLYHG